ncbi:MAG: hypothetical protein FRX48_04947 [Lasallia pustulata]|uniref:Uncharacterized protein n=1 Tax=Lasallia pustulata TaxID=136370 RepID=A0A5M8PQ18_9LECA|nr:MAG: hypothetical protein FRX48_04947 [Lasallia pustulata]
MADDLSPPSRKLCFKAIGQAAKSDYKNDLSSSASNSDTRGARYYYTKRSLEGRSRSKTTPAKPGTNIGVHGERAAGSKTYDMGGDDAS